MVKPKVYADFHNADANGRLRLNCVGTNEDLARQGVTLREGMLLTLYADDLDAKGQPDELLVDGVVSFSEEEHCWVAVIDWSAIHQVSGEQIAPAGGAKPSSEASAQENSRTRRGT
jgi:hypothetical protein